MSAKRSARIKAFVAATQPNAELWAAATAAAAAVREAVDNLARVVGDDVAADYLAGLLSTNRDIARYKKRSLAKLPPNAAGRRARDHEGDERLKGVLRRDGLKMSLSKIAAREMKADPRLGRIDKASAVKRLKRLKREIREADDRMWTALADEFAPGEQNRLLVMARALQAEAGTKTEQDS